MSMADRMQVTLLLPTGMLFSGAATKLTAVAPNGSFGILPNHVDLVTALVPSVLTLVLPEAPGGGSEAIFGIDEGLLVKTGHRVSVAVLRGLRGTDLASLHEAVAARFLQMDEDERQARTAVSRLEADMVRRFAELRRRMP